MSAHPDTSAQDKRPTTPEALMSALVSGPVLAIPHADWHFCRRLSWRLCQRSCWRLFLVPVSALGVGRLCVRLCPPLQPCRRMRGHPPADPVSKAKAKVGPKRQGPGLKTKAQGRRTKVQDSRPQPPKPKREGFSPKGPAPRQGPGPCQGPCLKSQAQSPGPCPKSLSPLGPGPMTPASQTLGPVCPSLKVQSPRPPSPN